MRNLYPLSLLFVLAGILVTPACTTSQKMRMKLDRINTDHFYTTPYSGEIERKYETRIQNPRGNHSLHLNLHTPPPRVTRFRRGERICVAVHSSPGERYRYQLVGVDPAPRLEWLSGMGKAQILDTPVKFSLFTVGGPRGGWQATCFQGTDLRMTGSAWRRYYETPSRWLWVDRLKPGEYTVRLIIKERRSGRTYAKDASFTVE